MLLKYLFTLCFLASLSECYIGKSFLATLANNSIVLITTKNDSREIENGNDKKYRREYQDEDDNEDEDAVDYINAEDTPCKPGLDECGINAFCDSLLEICICQEGSFGIYPGCCKENCERKRICDM